MNKQEALNKCYVEGNVIKLPSEQLERPVYMEVKKALEKIGGKWKGGKVFGFVFSSDPSELLKDVQSGKDRNIKKELQFFETPEDLAFELANVWLQLDEDGTQVVLEPSAGRGALINAIRKVNPNQSVSFFELDQSNADYINENFDNVYMIGNDFMDEDFHSYGAANFDRILANPPFTKNQDIKHVLKMYDRLKKGGRLVSVMSNHWTFGNDKESQEFRKFMDEVDGVYYEVPAGAFKSSGTMVKTVFVIIDK